MKIVEIDYAELVGVIAHEMHHITQNDKDILRAAYQGDDDNEVMQYLLEPAEIEALHLGFREQCAISGEDMRTAMLAYLAYRELNKKQLNEVVNAWVNVIFE